MISTSKGHLNQERQNLQSTKTALPHLKNEQEINDDFFPPSDSPNNKTHQCFATVETFVPTNKAYSDLTGKFVCKSSRGNQYLLIVYDYDSNTILQEPSKNRTAGEIKRAWSVIHAKLSKAGVAPQLYILDNEISTELKTKMAKNNIQFQLVPPHIHRRNAAERTIQTFKHHFLSTLATCDKNYPLVEWD